MGHKATKAKLLARRLGTTTVPTEVGDLVVRGLNRDEGRRVAEQTTLADRDRLMLSLGLVEPAMTPDEVDEWASAAPAGELEDVSRAIAGLSKMLDGDAKEQYKSLRG